MKKNAVVVCLIALVACVASVSRAEGRYDFRKRMSAPRAVRAEPFGGAPQAAGEIGLDGTWTFRVEASEPVVRHGEKELKDFLAKRFRVDCTGTDGTKRVVLAVAAEKDSLTSRLTVSADEIRVTGATPREVLQGCYRLEDELDLRDRPCLKAGSRTYTRMFSPRMTHSGYEIEKFPDWHMDEIAHAGMDAILVYIRDPPDVTRNGREDMNALVKRAAEHGLDVYAYYDRWGHHLTKHPLDPDADPYYDKMLGSIVKNAPGLKGLICVGESCGFPKRDGSDPGFNTFAPVLDWAPWLEMVTKVTRKWNPDFDVVFWTYNWARWPEKERLALLEAIPTNVSVHITFEMGNVPRDLKGIRWSVDDYSITDPGPSPTFTGEAAVVRRRGIRLTAMSNTGGRTWDFGGMPYEPVPYCWLERFKALRAAQKTYGVVGLMDSHHYGFTPNLCSDVAKRAFTREVSDDEVSACVDEVVARDFGAAAVPTVTAALKDWSAAMAWHSALTHDQYGVLRVGSTYPFVPLGSEIPDAPPAIYGERGFHRERGCAPGWLYVGPKSGIAWGHGATVKDLPAYIEISGRELALWASGNARLAGLKGEKAKRLLGLGKYCECAIRTQHNLQRYWKAFAERAPETDIQGILEEEAANVRALMPYVEADSQLGWEPSMRYVTDPDCLKWKLEQLKKAPVRDDAAFLQAILDERKGRVTFPEGTFVVSRSLRIGPDKHLVCSPRTFVRLADGANCPILVNSGAEPGGESRNITVEGGVWDGNNVNQKRGTYRPGVPGPWGQLMVFAGVKGLTVRDLTLKDPDSYCLELTDVEGFTVENIVFDCNDKTPNQDGLHIDGSARDGLVRNLRGHTNDDLVALNSDEGDWRSPSNDIENVTIDGLYGGDDGYTAVRLLSRNAHVNNVVIRNVYGRYKYNGVSFTHWAFKDHKPGMGHFDNIVIENMFASSCMKTDNGDWGMVYFQDGAESVGHVTVRNLRRVDGPDCRNGTYTVRIGKGVRIGTLVLDTVEQSVPGDKPLVWRHPTATVGNLIRK